MGTHGGIRSGRAQERDSGTHILLDRVVWKSYNVEPFLLRPAERDLRVLVRELFLVGHYLLFRASPDFQHG